MSTSIGSTLRSANYYFFELFIFFRLLAFSISAIAISFLVQDKVCIVRYNQTADFCTNIEANSHTGAQLHLRDEILSDAAIFNNWKNLVEVTPMVLLSLFVGSFLDNHPSATFIVMFINVLGDIYSIAVYLLLVHFFDTSPYLLLTASLYVWFTGGTMAFSTTAYRYITLTTDEKSRALRFVVLEIIFVIGLSISIFFGGRLLKVQLNSVIPRTYSNNFELALLFDIIALLSLFALHYVTSSPKTPEPQSTTVVYNIEDDLLKVNPIVLTSYWKNIDLESPENGAVEEVQSTVKAEQVVVPPPPKPQKNLLQMMFDIKSAQDTIDCFLKPRPHHFRLLIYLCFLVLFNTVLTTSGIHGVFLQFTEKVYNFDTKMYSTFVAVSHIVSTVTLAISSVLLVKILKLDDSALIVLATVSSFCAYVLIGTFASPKAYFAAILIGSLHGYAVICIRTKLSKVIPADEVGKIFCVSCTLEALVPLVSSVIYSFLFSISISTYPTLIYQFSAFIALISLVVLTYEVYKCPIQNLKQLEEIQREKTLRHQQQINGISSTELADRRK